MKKIFIIPMLLLIISGCSSVAPKPEITELNYFYFDTSMSIKIYDQVDTKTKDQIDSEIDSLLKELENKYSPSITTSTVNQVNDQKVNQVDDQFISILSDSIAACKQSKGLYDPTSGQLVDLWSITNDNHLPTQAEVDKALTLVGCDKVQIEGNKITMPTGYRLDFGSSVKGYGADQIEDILKSNEVDNAIINLGGNIQAVGNKYGSPFTIAIMKPEVENTTNENVATMPIESAAMVTSGINQRFFVEDGKVYHHIINALDGYPADNGLASVTIITDSGAKADILSTMTFLMGLEDGYDYIQSVDGVDAIFITTDKKIYETKDFNLELLDEAYSIEKIE